MPVSVSYPGLYIEELPSSARSIAAAPTSIAVFVGYTHPFKTSTPGQPVRIFSFSDFEREFGGLFVSASIDASLPHAVNQFFLNGGSDAYVVGLVPRYQINDGTSQAIAAATATLVTTGGSAMFTALEPTDHPQFQPVVTLGNVRASSAGGVLDTADFTIAYGTRVETYRGVLLSQAALDAGINRSSSLVRIAPPPGGGTLGTAFASTSIPPLTLTSTLPANLVGTFSSLDFTGVFQANQPLDKVDIFNLLVTPGISDNGVLSAALAFAERKQAFAIMDPPRNAGADSAAPPVMVELFKSGTIPLSTNGAIYFPYLKSTNPLTGDAIELPPSGFVAGIYARTDARRGVWKAPAGLEAVVNNTTGVVASGRMNDQAQGVYNLAGVNCLRTFPGSGTVVFGARTLVSANPSFQQNQYVPVRRMTLFIEQTLLQNLRWVIFEPNDEPLWLAIRTTVENFMLSLFNQHALQGTKPSDAFQVKCDRTTTTQDDINLGRVNIVVAFAPLKPAEFVIIKIAHLAGQSQ
ncbi:phage tail sheath subtilisin-like domain-containing protein [uncultured Thiodictyon sp.]|uniref:phage tail sheath family protein n=1 Tax=uncultured Thiodictyon sp. TaxID=1846217 RepID=UPI0025DE4A1F|nr:phage tail sheath subtilisin-like domain-containing protein [uncultured Thiodictyon sp.]